MQNNVQTEMKGDKLVITVDVSKKVKDNAPLSKTGKSHMIATTGGFVGVQDGISVGLNVILKKS